MSIFGDLHDLTHLKELLAENTKVLKEMSITLTALNKNVQLLTSAIQKQENKQ